MESTHLRGVELGAPGKNGALVEGTPGDFPTERFRVPTPKPATPQAIAEAFNQLVAQFNWKGRPVGVGFPAIVKKGVALSAANIDKGWIGTNIEALFESASGCPVLALNDADAAGITEMKFGVGHSQMGVVILITIGTGLGSAFFLDGRLVPNTELGHIFFEDQIAEHYASNTARKKYKLSWKNWGKRFNKYLLHLDRVFSPDLVILGGGSSKKFDQFKDVITASCAVKPAEFLNNAGIVGAALYAAPASVTSLSHISWLNP